MLLRVAKRSEEAGDGEDGVGVWKRRRKSNRNRGRRERRKGKREGARGGGGREES